MTTTIRKVTLEPDVVVGEGALRLHVPPGIGARALLAALKAVPRVVDVVLTETCVCVYYDPAAPPSGPWELSVDVAAEGEPSQTHVVPVRYGGEDLEEVAKTAGLSVAETIQIHSGATYTVAMLGAFPGFAYLRGIDPRLALPRRTSVRPRLRPNVLAIAAGYTAIYPFVWPNGWNVIGDVQDFQAFTAESGCRLRLGDSVRFEAVR